jgi:glycosyltransferase involved in cell wall biosynthesis
MTASSSNTAERPRHLWIIAPVNTAGLAKKLGINLQIGAGTRKVFGMLYAAQAVGWKGHLLSTPIIGKHGGWHLTPGLDLIENDVSVHYKPAIGVPWLNRILAAWHYFKVACQLHRQQDHVVFYNLYPEYVPAAFMLLCRGLRATIDIEDFPDNQKGLRSLLNRLFYPLVRSLCNPHLIVASTGIADIAKAKKSCVIHGIVTPEDSGRDPRPDEIIRILYGGTICLDTGSEVCAEALRILRRQDTLQVQGIELMVTGFGDVRPFQALEREFHPQVKVRVCADLNPHEYLSVLRACHIGLCLKMPDSNLGLTTFPSKVVELTANGLALISTAVSDVPQVFGDVAVVLEQADAPSLASALQELAVNRARIADLSARGYARTLERYAPGAVGLRLTTFLMNAEEKS